MKLDHTRDILKTYCDENNADVTDTSSIDLFEYISWLERRAAAAPEMLEVLIKTYNHQIKCGRESIVVDEIKSIIERATGKKIEEVLE